MKDNLPHVQVFSENELLERLQSGESHFSHCISIRNPDQQMPPAIKEAFSGILELRFYDVDTVDQLGPAQTIKRAPRRIDVQGVIEFYKITKAGATGYTIHCWQGISRSPAIALGLLYLMTRSEEQAAKALQEMRPDARPHQMLVRFFDQELGCQLSVFNDRIRWQALESLRTELASLGAAKAAPAANGGGLLRKAKRLRKEREAS